MIKVAFIIVVSLAVILNLTGYIAEKVYKRRMSAKAKDKEFNNMNGSY